MTSVWGESSQLKENFSNISVIAVVDIVIDMSLLMISSNITTAIVISDHGRLFTVNEIIMMKFCG